MQATNTKATAHIQRPIRLFPVWMNSQHPEEKENTEISSQLVDGLVVPLVQL
jgi:hypothetical protein